MSFNYVHVINICSVSFFIDDGNNIPNGVNLYATFFCFLSKLTTLSSSISICAGFNQPTIQNFCLTRTITVSTGSCISNFLFLPNLVKDKL